MLDIAQQLGSRSTEGIAWTRLGQDLMGLENFERAETSYKKALVIQRELGQDHWAAETLVGLVDVALQKGDVERVQEYVDEIIEIIEAHDTVGMREPFNVYLTCYRALESLQEARAQNVLERAYRDLQTIAGKISDEEMRRSFLYDVVTHSEIMDAWNSVDNKPNLDALK